MPRPEPALAQSLSADLTDAARFSRDLGQSRPILKDVGVGQNAVFDGRHPQCTSRLRGPAFDIPLRAGTRGVRYTPSRVPVFHIPLRAGTRGPCYLQPRVPAFDSCCEGGPGFRMSRAVAPVFLRGHGLAILGTKAKSPAQRRRPAPTPKRPFWRDSSSLTQAKNRAEAEYVF